MAAERRRTKIVATIGPVSSTHDTVRALVDAGVDAIRLNLSHGTHEDHAARAQVVREVQEETRQAARADRRPAGAEAPHRRPAGAAHPARRTRRCSSSASRRAATASCPVAPAVIGEVLRPGHDVLIDDGLVRLRGRGGRARPRPLPRRRRRRGEVAQGRQPARRAGADPVADEEGSRRPRLRARAGRRLRRALVRPRRRRRARPAGDHPPARLARARDREDREGRGDRGARGGAASRPTR